MEEDLKCGRCGDELDEYSDKGLCSFCSFELKSEEDDFLEFE